MSITSSKDPNLVQSFTKHCMAIFLAAITFLSWEKIIKPDVFLKLYIVYTV